MITHVKMLNMKFTTDVNAFTVGVSIAVGTVIPVVVYYTGRVILWIYRIPSTRAALNRGVRPFHEMPRPRGWLPFIGHSYLIRNRLHETYQEWRQQYGNIFNCQMGGVNTVVLSCPRLINQAFRKPEFCGKPPLSVTTEIMANKGIIHSGGPLWREQRSFALRCLRDLGFIGGPANRGPLEINIEAQVADLLRRIEAIGNVPHDYSDNIRTTILNIICQVLFGRSFNNSVADRQLINRQIALQEEGPALVSLSQWANYFPFLKYIPYLNRGYLRLCANKEEHHSFLSNVVGEHEERFNIHYVGPNPDVYLTTPSTSFIEAYLKTMRAKENAGEMHYFSRIQLLHCLGDLFGAGTGTIVSNVLFGLLYLANRETVQMEAYEELQRVVGARPMPTLEDIDKLHYVKAIVSEVQRIASIVPHGTPHGATTSETLDEYLIPKDTMIISFFWGMNHNNDYFPHPQQFDPERFLDKERKYFDPPAFIPFSKGGRDCVGQSLARKVMYLTFAAILHRFKIVCPDGDPDFMSEEAFIFFPRPQNLLITLRPPPEVQEHVDHVLQ